MPHYLVLFIRHTCFSPWSQDLNVFSSQKTTLDQKSRRCPTYWEAKLNRPARCSSVSFPFLAGTLWWIPAPWSRLRMVSTDTCKCRCRRCSTVVRFGCSWVTCIIMWSSWGVVTRGLGLLPVKYETVIGQEYLFFFVTGVLQINTVMVIIHKFTGSDYRTLIQFSIYSGLLGCYIKCCSS